MRHVDFVIGGDGFCGWPTSLYLAKQGHDVVILDNLSRRKIDIETSANSLTNIASIEDRISTANELVGSIKYEFCDVSNDPLKLRALIKKYKPSTIIHFGEQRAAPYSMIDDKARRYTLDNNVVGTHNLCSAIVDIDLDINLVHLGTMGVYGYSKVFGAIPEGYLDIEIKSTGNDANILYPANPGSVYHLTKCLDQLVFQFYSKNWGLKVTDLHQGIVWGTNTDVTSRDPRLTNRFDYDGDYGTVLNRFLMQAAIGYPLTVHGTGGQTRAFIHIQDSVKCVQLALENPPEKGERVKIFNQMTESHQVGELAKKVASLTGAKINYLPNPRNEAVENDLIVDNRCFIELGLDPTTLDNGLLEEVVNVAKKFSNRCDLKRIPCVSAWTSTQAKAIHKS